MCLHFISGGGSRAHLFLTIPEEDIQYRWTGCQGWMGDSTSIQASITDAVNHGTNRCVFVGSVEHAQTEQELRDEFIMFKEN